MADLNRHEAGNGGYGQREPKATAPVLYSTEIFIVSVADVVHLTKGSTLIADSPMWAWRCDASLTGSETVARYQMDIMGTREGQSVLLTSVCPIKPINGKIVQTTHGELRSVLIKLFKSLTDQFIVPEKQGNAYRGKGLAGARWTSRDTPSIPRDGRGVSTKLWFITLQAREDPTCEFTSLAHLLTADFLKECFWELKRDKAPGIDGVTWREYEENLDENIEDFVAILKVKRYRPQPVKRVFIPKPNGDKRPIGIPAIEDKIVQLAIKKILEAIFKVGRKTSSEKFRQKMKDMNQWLKGVQNRVKLKVWWPLLRQKLVGHYQYYSISGNQFNRFLPFNPLPKLRIYHFYTLSKRRGCTPEEPDEGKHQVLFCEGAHGNRGAITPIGGGL